MDFSDALRRMKAGEAVVRDYWRSSVPVAGQVARMAPSTTTHHPHLEIMTTEGLWAPYQPTPKDLFADDWKPVSFPSQ